jgi:putative oxidoreductase
MTAKSKNILNWCLSAFVAALLLLSVFMKLSGNPQAAAQFIAWGYSDSFRIFIGVCELFGAVGLLIPPFTTLAASGLSIIMTGAVFTHLSHDQAPQALIPLVLLLIVLSLAHERRSEIGTLFGRAPAADAPHAHAH